VREYLSGLIEDSGIKDAFAHWAGSLSAASVLPTAETLVEPDPAKLQTVAYNELAAEFTAAGHAVDIKTDQAVIIATTESPITAAVALANQSIQPDITGCAGCTPYEPDDDFVPADDG
jgi:thioredoxin-like negative regulator of GroEL